MKKTIYVEPILRMLRDREDNPEDLPPLTTGDFIRMLEEAEDINVTTNGDTISRQAAIKAIKVAKIAFSVESTTDFTKLTNEVQQIIDGVVDGQTKALKELPSAERTGHWIWDAGDLYCSECGTRYSDLYPDYDDSVACPHCGAHMKGGETDA